MADAGDDDHPATWRELLKGSRLWVTAILSLGLWLNAADALVVSTIMPSVAKDVCGYAYFSWATAVFMLGSILAGAVAGLTATKAGLRRALAASALLYAGVVWQAASPRASGRFSPAAPCRGREPASSSAYATWPSAPPTRSVYGR